MTVIKLLITVLFVWGFNLFAQLPVSGIAKAWQKLQAGNDYEKNYRFHLFTETVLANSFTNTDTLPEGWICSKIQTSGHYVAAGILRFSSQPSRLIWLIWPDGDKTGSIFFKEIVLSENDSAKITVVPKQLQNIAASAFSISVNGKNQVEIPDIELSMLFSKLNKSDTDNEKENIGNEIGIHLRSLLENELLLNLTDYDQLSAVVSADKKVRICTWNIEYKSGEQRFFGVLAIAGTPKPAVYELNDRRAMLNNAAYKTLSPSEWYGCIYYDILENRYRDDTNYTLIGFNGNSAFSQIKLVDVLTFSKKGNPSPQFGASVFTGMYKNNRRIIYEYSKKATMMLRYDAREKMIVMDNLAPVEPVFQNNFRFYGPDFSYNGFKFEDGKWIFYQDIDLRNPQP